MVHESTARHAIRALQLHGEVHQTICSVHMKQKQKQKNNNKNKNVEICIPNKVAVSEFPLAYNILPTTNYLLQPILSVMCQFEYNCNDL